MAIYSPTTGYRPGGQAAQAKADALRRTAYTPSPLLQALAGFCMMVAGVALTFIIAAMFAA